MNILRVPPLCGRVQPHSPNTSWWRLKTTVRQTHTAGGEQSQKKTWSHSHSYTDVLLSSRRHPGATWIISRHQSVCVSGCNMGVNGTDSLLPPLDVRGTAAFIFYPWGFKVQIEDFSSLWSINVWEMSTNIRMSACVRAHVLWTWQ